MHAVQQVPFQPYPAVPIFLPAPERVIAGRYLLLSKLGEGGHAAVWLARQLTTNREVALKLLDHTQCEPEMLTRFMREAQVLSQLNHPHTITCHDFGSDDALGLHFLAMEYVQGQTLQQILVEHGPLPAFRVAQLIRQVAASLDDAHAHGLLHRDLKPSNIMLTHRRFEDHVKLIDFGIARNLATSPDVPALTRQDIVIGTPHYMAPEQLLRRPLTPQTDVYALGVVAFELLTGRRPFEHPKTLELVRQIIAEQPPSLAAAAPTLSFTPALNVVIQQALHHDPAQRFASASAFADALDQAWQSTEDRTISASLSEVQAAMDLVMHHTKSTDNDDFLSRFFDFRTGSFVLGATFGALLGVLWTLVLS